jgi:hypothetical protein
MQKMKGYKTRRKKYKLIKYSYTAIAEYIPLMNTEEKKKLRKTFIGCTKKSKQTTEPKRFL